MLHSLVPRAMEKRTRQRKKTSLPARFGAERPEKMGLITDVSARGIYVSTNAVLSKGSAVHVQVKVPGGEPMLLQGRVIRTRRVASSLVMITTGGMGVRLENPPPGWRVNLSLPEEV
jgi:hypothetical protein